jgi:predicted nucleotide-binding protein
MAKRPPVTPPPDEPTIDVERGLPLLRRQHVDGTGLVQTKAGEQEIDAWETQTEHWLQAVFGKGAQKVATVMDAGHRRVIDRRRDDVASYRRGILVDQLNQLSAVIKIVEQEASEPAPRWGSKPRASATPAPGRKVFIVHGHEDGTKEMVARFISKLDLEPVILHEQASKGRTVIEKFEDHGDPAEIAFAVVLLTPDDRGGTSTTPYDDQRPRARQNVVLELGWFLGKLGRDRVCALHKGDVEMPSDFAGVIYVALDPGGAWRFQLAKELRQVIPSVDMNKAIE